MVGFWDELKAAEKGRGSVLDGIPLALPALALADKTLGRAARVGVTAPSAPESLGDRLLAVVVEARAAGLDAEQELRAFGRELADVQMYADIQLCFDSFTRFFDTFCDNFFVDWMVQSQILQAQDRVEEVRQRVWEAVQQLQFLQGA